MKKNFRQHFMNLKQVAVFSVFLGMAAVPVFALGNGNKQNNFERGPFMESRKGFPAHGNPNMNAMGTVVDVNQKTNIITIEDADGNKTTVHYNPTTRVYNFTTFENDDDFECFGMGPGMDGNGMMGLGSRGFQGNMMGQGALPPQDDSNTADNQKQMTENREAFQKQREADIKTFQEELKKYELKTTDIKPGDWIQVTAYPGTTKTLESHMIRVYR